MAPTEFSSSPIWKIFSGERCEACGGVKRKYNAFCTTCYYRLSRPLRESLYRPFGDGFEESYRVCIAWFPAHPSQQERKRA